MIREDFVRIVLVGLIWLPGKLLHVYIYISTCGKQIAVYFAAEVALLAEQNNIWNGTSIFGHSTKVAGPVPPPNDISWY